ncbi:Signal Peptide Peptidase-Like 2B [Manis pentadactyla]|nr:Signal Peptide Peptidase-Like 2B [Manis pentadactyla]
MMTVGQREEYMKHNGTYTFEDEEKKKEKPSHLLSRPKLVPPGTRTVEFSIGMPTELKEWGYYLLLDKRLQKRMVFCPGA